jgi:hypothetical protein
MGSLRKCVNPPRAHYQAKTKQDNISSAYVALLLIIS